MDALASDMPSRRETGFAQETNAATRQICVPAMICAGTAGYVIVHSVALSIDTRDIVVSNATSYCVAFGAWGRSRWPGRFPAMYQVQRSSPLLRSI
jgi:hypothetical protein